MRLPLEVFAARRDHIPGLDGLRAIAVLMVLWAHLPASVFPEPIRMLAGLVQPGYFGVDLFFVLSGFLITRILLVDRQRGNPLGEFLIKRALRIFPIYYLLIVICWIYEPGAYLVWSAVYLSNFYFAYDLGSAPLRHTWSLAVEEHFYLIWPLIAYYAPFRIARASALVVIPLIAVAATVGIYFIVPEKQAFEWIYRVTIFRCLSLSAGASLAFLEPWLRARRANAFGLGAISFLAGGAAGVVGLFIVRRFEPAFALVAFAGISSALVSVTIGLHQSRGSVLRFIERLLTLNVFMYCGRISYGLYLYHFPIFRLFGLLDGEHAAARAEQSPLFLTGAALVVSFAVATGSFYLIERPILTVKDRVKLRPAAAAPGTAAPVDTKAGT